MSSKYIDSGSYAVSGYTLSGVFQSLTIGSQGSIGGPGIAGGPMEAYTIVNRGKIAGVYDGVYLHDGGDIVNSTTAALIRGYDGIHVLGGAGSVMNMGAIEATGSKGIGVLLTAGGSVTNGANAAVISSAYGVDIQGSGASVTNKGAISGSDLGVFLSDGGAVKNAGTQAFITGGDGVFIDSSAGTVSNTGTIQGTFNGYFDPNMGSISYAFAVYLAEGGSIDNQASGIIDCTGSIGIGVQLAAPGAVSNAGTIEATGPGARTYGIFLRDGGRVTNSGGAVIEGNTGIRDVGGSIDNAGVIEGEGGTTGIAVSVSLTAGISNQRGGIIQGATGVSIYNLLIDPVIPIDTIDNAGTIQGLGSAGIGISVVEGDGLVINASGALIQGDYGIDVQRGTVTIANYGTIKSGAAKEGAAIVLDQGAIRNASGGDIEGDEYCILLDSRSTVSNAGKIEAVGTESSDIAGFSSVAIYFRGESTLDSVVNFSGGIIEGSDGIVGGSSAVVTASNAGLVLATGTYGAGVLLRDGGTFTNTGSVEATGNRSVAVIHYGKGLIANSATGIILGAIGVGGTGSITNFGTIIGNGVGRIDHGHTYLGSGVLVYGANLVNGLSGQIEATGSLSAGIYALVDCVISNAGSIVADSTSGVGVYTKFSGTITNAAGGLIAGYVGVQLGSAGTIENFGTIASLAGADGTAVRFLTSNDLLVDEAGSTFVGAVEGGGGTLDLVGSAGTISGLGTNFSGFGVVGVLTGAVWTVTGSSVLANGTTSSLINSGVLALAGTSTIAGTVSGTGTLKSAAGQTSLTNGAALTVANLTVSGGTLAVGVDLTYAGSFVQGGGTLTVATDTLSLTGKAAFTGGTVAGSGLLATHGRTSLTNFTVTGGALWQDDGPVIDTGRLTLGDAGGGTGRLMIETGSVFDITTNGGILVATGGSGTIVNEAVLEKTGGTGISTIGGKLGNNGTIDVTAGLLNVQGAVGGNGSATIGSGGTLRFDGIVAATQTIHFAGTAGGELMLHDPLGSGLGFAGVIAGFGGEDRLDLTSFAFSGKPTIGWVQNGAKGTLTVTDGPEVAKITLFGQYATAGFGTAKDATGGTLVTYALPSHQVTLANAHR